MGNLNLTIDAFRIALETGLGEDNSLCFITTNGIYIGKQLLVNPNLTPDDIGDAGENLMHFIYSQVNKSPESDSEENENPELKNLNYYETILLEDVLFKTSDTTMHLKNCVLNINQIVSIQIVSNELVDDLIENY